MRRTAAFALGAIALAVAAWWGIKSNHDHSSDVKSDHDDSIDDIQPITHLDRQHGPHTTAPQAGPPAR